MGIAPGASGPDSTAAAVRPERSVDIEIENLEIRYGAVPAVKGVSFVAPAGQQLTLLGPSGCGKTTTLRAIAGLERPSSGAIRIGGKAVYSSAEGINIPAEKRGLSMVFQSYAIWPHMTVFDNVAYGLRVRRKSRNEIEEKVRKALDLVQMGQYAERPASQLSGGQQQRVALARACVFSPSVLLFDEPLSNLDAKLRGDMRIELRELQHRLGVTSVYVTHDLEEALAMSDRIIVMRNGNIEQTGTPDRDLRYTAHSVRRRFRRLLELDRRPAATRSRGGRPDRAGNGSRPDRAWHNGRTPGWSRAGVLRPHRASPAQLRPALLHPECLACPRPPLRIPGRFLPGERNLGRPRPCCSLSRVGTHPGRTRRLPVG